MNRDGGIAVAPRFDFVDEFHEGRALVRLGGLYGFVDSNGKVVIEPQYALAGRYRLGYAEVDIDGKSALIDREGRPVLEPRFARAGAFTKGVFWVNDGVRIIAGRWPAPYSRPWGSPPGPPKSSLWPEEDEGASRRGRHVDLKARIHRNRDL